MYSYYYCVCEPFSIIMLLLNMYFSERRWIKKNHRQKTFDSFSVEINQTKKRNDLSLMQPFLV